MVADPALREGLSSAVLSLVRSPTQTSVLIPLGKMVSPVGFSCHSDILRLGPAGSRGTE